MDMSRETDKMAPTSSIEQVVIVRPLKVVAVLLGFFDIVLLIMFIGASSWVNTDLLREGLWEVCLIVEPGRVDCSVTEARTWIMACRGLCLMAMAMCFTACIIVCCGLKAEKFRTRYRCYFISMLVYFLAVLFNVTALIIYPIKYSEEMEARGKEESWSFGWTYGLGWVSTVILISSAILLCLDKDADEIVYREITNQDNGIEEELLTNMEVDKSDTESDIAYADEILK